MVDVPAPPPAAGRPRPRIGFQGSEARAERQQGTGGASLAVGGSLEEYRDPAGGALRRAVAAWVGRPVLRAMAGHPAGQRERVDWPTTLREAHRFGGRVLHMAAAPSPKRPVRLVVLWDVSGSMADHIPLYLPWLTRVVRGRGSTGVVAFGTEVRDITRVLRDAGLDQAAELRGLSLFGGGTAIGRAVEALLDAQLVSPTTRVVIISDGLEAEAPGRLAAAMAALSSRARRVVWLNPLAATPGYEPVQRGIMIARRYVARLYAGASLEDLARIGRAES